jgi:glycosyltransferase involved in cell wall biosynthesis
MSKKQSLQKKLRIFLNSNAPWSTSGYANQVAEFLPLMRDEGYPVAMCDFYGLEGGKLHIDGILHYPKINHVYGSDALIHHARDFKADVVFTLQDIWVLNPQDLQRVNRFIPIVPIDHEPVPKAIIDRLKLAYRIISYSEFGREELKKNGLNSTYIQHTVNTDIFKPMDKKERKRLAGLPEDAFICGMVAANKDNPPRKSFQEVMDAFKMFLEKVPHAYLYIHTNPDFPGGFPIKEYASQLGIMDKLLLPDPYQMNFNIGKKEMALIYNTFDMLLMPSVSEGFGVPAIEAQACGIPVIVNNFTSMKELVKKHVTGEICDVQHKKLSHLMSYIGIPSTQSIFDCMMRIYNADRIKMGEEARTFIIENYDTKKIYKEKWSPFLAKLEKEIYT